MSSEKRARQKAGTQARRAAQQEAAARAKKRRTFIKVGVIVLAVLGTFLGITLSGRDDGDDSAVTPPPPAGAEVVAEPADDADEESESDDEGATSRSDCVLSQSVPNATPSVFQVITDTSQGTGLGTAFYIGDNKFLTAQHVVSEAHAIRLSRSNHDLPAEVLDSDRTTDIALLRASGTGITPLTLGRVRDVTAGVPVAAIGYPLSEAHDPSVTRGILSRVVDDPDLGTRLQTDAAVNPGNSGGPVIDECGTVLGMTTTKFVGVSVEGISYAIAENTLREFLSRVRGSNEVEADSTPADEGMGDEGTAGGPDHTPYSAGEYGAEPCAPAGGVTEPVLDFDGPPMLCIDPAVAHTAVFDTSRGTVRVALDVTNTPGTVNSFVNLARFGYYDGTLIHRSDPSIGILQGGSPHTDSAADPGPGYTLWDEGTGFTYRPGQLVMARRGDPNSAGAQYFFTVTTDAALLDGQGTYVVFGDVTDGLDVLSDILASHVNDPESRLGGAPDPPVVINTLTVETG